MKRACMTEWKNGLFISKIYFALQIMNLLYSI